MEPELTIKCRKSDLEIVKSVSHKAVEEYKALMKKEVKHFHNKEVPINLIIEDKRFLSEYTPNSNDSCMGGVVLHARRGRIVCANTLDDRLQLVY
jgi:vacuolar-type H+-ATPase subunit E/Vma4